MIPRPCKSLLVYGCVITSPCYEEIIKAIDDGEGYVASFLIGHGQRVTLLNSGNIVVEGGRITIVVGIKAVKF